MNNADLQTRAVQSLVRRTGEFRAYLLALSGSDSGAYHYGSSIAYGSWDLIKLFSDTPRIASEVRTMEDIARYMSGHREHEFYCQMELCTFLNSVLDQLARRFLADRNLRFDRDRTRLRDQVAGAERENSVVQPRRLPVRAIPARALGADAPRNSGYAHRRQRGAEQEDRTGARTAGESHRRAREEHGQRRRDCA